MQLTRRQTMKRAYEFAMVRTEGRSDMGRFLILGTHPLPQGPTAPSRFGIITTKRVGHAHTRNLMRRRVRELLRAHGEPLEHGYYVVLVVRNRAAWASYAELEKDLLKLLARHQRRQPQA